MTSERLTLAACLLLSGCYAESPGVAWTLEFAAEPPTQHTRTAAADWSVRSGWIAVTHAELVPCSPDDDLASLDELAASVVVPLDQPEQAVEMGTLRPMPGAWCGVAIQYGPVGSLEDPDGPDGTWTLDVAPLGGATRHLRGSDRELTIAPLDPPWMADLEHRDTTVSVALPLCAWLSALDTSADEPELVAAVHAALADAPRVAAP